MLDRRTQLGTFAIASLVFLRLATGWHFFTAGVEKIGYDPAKGGYAVTFTSAPFFAQAKGPLAEFYQSRGPNGHDWKKLLAVAQPMPNENLVEQGKWLAAYQRKLDEAGKKNVPVEAEFPEFAPYHAWANQIVGDWRAIVDQAKSVEGLADEQRDAMDNALATREQQLALYLASETEAIAEWQHELWRLESWQRKNEAADVPFYQERIAKKTADTLATPRGWLAQVEAFETGLVEDLRAVLTPAQVAEPETYRALQTATVSSRASRLATLDWGVTILTIGVGICLLVGLFTRTASVIGALFLLSVIATQPFWIADAAPTINQCVELAGLLVLAGTGAGRWLGLDFFPYAWRSGCCASDS